VIHGWSSPYILSEKLSEITRVSSVIRPKGSDLIFDHPYNAEYLWPTLRTPWRGPCTQMVQFCAVVVAEQTLSSRHESASVIGPDGIVVSSALGPRAGVSCPRHRTCATACCAQSCRFVARSVTASASAAMVLACAPQSLPGGVPCRWGRFLVLLEPTVNPVGSVLFGPAGTRKVRLR
jgi:hypothetical protein